MLFFYKCDTNTYYVLDNTTGKIEFISCNNYYILLKYKNLIGGIDLLNVKDDNTLKQFRKIAKTGEFKNVSSSNTKQYLLENYPELFI